MRRVSKFKDSFSNVQSCMSKNFLKLNADKIEVTVIGSRVQLAKFNLHKAWVMFDWYGNECTGRILSSDLPIIISLTLDEYAKCSLLRQPT